MDGWKDGRRMEGWKDGRMEGGMMNSSLVPRLVLEYAAFSSKQGVTKPLVLMGKGIDGEDRSFPRVISYFANLLPSGEAWNEKQFYFPSLKLLGWKIFL